MSDAMGTTVLNGLPNGFLSESLARMNGDVEILPLDIVKCVDVLLRGITTLFTRQIKAHNPALAKVNGEFGHFERHVHVAHRADDQPGRNTKIFSAPLQTLQHGQHNLLVAQSPLRVKYRGKAGLKINDTVLT